MEKILGIKLKLSEARNNDLMFDYLNNQQGGKDDDNQSQKSGSKLEKLQYKEGGTKVHNRNLVKKRENDKVVQ